MAYLQEISRNKIKMMELFLTNPQFVELLSDPKDSPSDVLSLQYSQLFPYAWVNNTVDEEQTFVCFDIDVPKVINKSIKEVQLWVWIFTHENLMRMSDGSGTRLDVFASCVDRILNGNSELGASQVELKSVSRFTPAKNFYGRQLLYHVKDINRVVCV